VRSPDRGPDFSLRPERFPDADLWCREGGRIVYELFGNPDSALHPIKAFFPDDDGKKAHLVMACPRMPVLDECPRLVRESSA